MPPANVPRRLPLTSTSVDEPPRPRSDAVWLLNVVAPMMLPIVTLPALLFAEMRFSSSTALVAPLRSMSSRVIAWTGSAPSPSTRLMFDPVTSTLMSAACRRRGAQRGDSGGNAHGHLEVLAAHPQSIHGNSPNKRAVG